MNSEYCDQHSALDVKIESLEEDVKSLWKKWDSLQKLLIMTLTTLCLNLAGIILIMVKLFSD